MKRGNRVFVGRCPTQNLLCNLSCRKEVPGGELNNGHIVADQCPLGQDHQHTVYGSALNRLRRRVECISPVQPIALQLLLCYPSQPIEIATFSVTGAMFDRGLDILECTRGRSSEDKEGGRLGIRTEGEHERGI